MYHGLLGGTLTKVKVSKEFRNMSAKAVTHFYMTILLGSRVPATWHFTVINSPDTERCKLCVTRFK